MRNKNIQIERKDNYLKVIVPNVSLWMWLEKLQLLSLGGMFILGSYFFVCLIDYNEDILLTIFTAVPFIIFLSFVLLFSLPLIYKKFGYESVTIGDVYLVLERGLFFIKAKKAYKLDFCQNLRREECGYSRFAGASKDFWGWGGGSFAFDYGTDTIRFGSFWKYEDVRKVDEIFSLAKTLWAKVGSRENVK